jgi:curli biogenesis system outer membrane secretion channel CsgG/TolA-binding protein
MRLKLCGVLALFFVFTVFGTPAPAADVIRVGVMEFVSKASGVSNQEADAIRDVFTRYLANSKTVAVIERERLLSSVGSEIKISVSGLIDADTAVQIGRLAGCQYMLFGSVTELSEKASAGVIPLGVVGISVGNREAIAVIDMRVVDVSTGETVLSLSESGSSSDSVTGIATQMGGFAETTFGGIKGRAIEDAVTRLGNKVLEELGGEYDHVLSVSGNTVRISGGQKSGVKKGDLFMVYFEGPEITDIDGTPLGKDRIPIAVIKVANAQSGFSDCEVATSGGKVANIQRGDRLESISSKMSKDLVDRKVFPSERPRKRAYDDTASLLFSNSPQQLNSAQSDSLAQDAEGSAPLMSSEPLTPSARSNTLQSPATAGTYAWKQVDGVDMNTTTDAKLIDAYPLSSVEKNTIGIQHRGAYKLYTNKKYKDAFEIFSKLAADFSCNYLSAYWAGVCAARLGSNKEAEKWFDYALAINGNYEPAIDGKAKLGESPKNKK